MTPYKNPWTARSRLKENKRHVRFLMSTDSVLGMLRKGSFENCLIINNGALVCLTYVASGSVVKCSLSLFKAFNMNNEEKKRRKRGRHEADRGRHEADRGRHEAELWNEDMRYMWFPMAPNS
ncbi:hypothetical protein T10_5188, partial [Trichinella papuae]